ncbi:MAG TPA: hypothetical protein VFV03_03825, partial [Solirubrobacteraceae bacterium]|nr:hypothetical protein [Solirubrobacteraceae bacterium]
MNASVETRANGASPAGAREGIAVKPGRHREASLYHALAGAGAGAGHTLAELREQAERAFEQSELPVWRRSGFWTTSFAELDLEALATREHPRDSGVPDFVTSTIPERPRAGRIVQLDSSVVHVELDQDLAERGVILCSLEEAAESHTELFERWYSKRLTIDRHKLEAANAAFWTGGAFLYVPDGLVVENPFEIVNAISGPGVAQYGRTLVIGGCSTEFRVHEHNLASDFAGLDAASGGARDSERGAEPGTTDGARDSETGCGQSLHAGAFEMYLQDGARCRLAQVQDWGPAQVFD